jgi:hypothetical protein
MAYDDAPSDEIFDQIKAAAISIWRTYDNTYGYATEKIDRINELTNFKDNWGTMVGMFDSDNQARLLALLALNDQWEALEKVREWL